LYRSVRARQRNDALTDDRRSRGSAYAADGARGAVRSPPTRRLSNGECRTGLDTLIRRGCRFGGMPVACQTSVHDASRAICRRNASFHTPVLDARSAMDGVELAPHGSAVAPDRCFRAKRPMGCRWWSICNKRRRVGAWSARPTKRPEGCLPLFVWRLLSASLLASDVKDSVRVARGRFSRPNRVLNARQAERPNSDGETQATPPAHVELDRCDAAEAGGLRRIANVCRRVARAQIGSLTRVDASARLAVPSVIWKERACGPRISFAGPV
jgi:hypothetical protein